MEEKKCTQCGKILPITEFHWRNKAKGQRRSECKYCHNKHMNQKNAENRATIQNLKKETVCQKCGESRWYLLDYHHIDPTTKKNTVARLTIHSSLENALEEIDKCIPLCSNCHREFHYFEKEKNISLLEYLNLTPLELKNF